MVNLGWAQLGLVKHGVEKGLGGNLVPLIGRRSVNST